MTHIILCQMFLWLSHNSMSDVSDCHIILCQMFLWLSHVNMLVTCLYFNKCDHYRKQCNIACMSRISLNSSFNSHHQSLCGRAAHCHLVTSRWHWGGAAGYGGDRTCRGQLFPSNSMTGDTYSISLQKVSGYTCRESQILAAKSHEHIWPNEHHWVLDYMGIHITGRLL